MPQLHLYFTALPVPEIYVWEQFSDEQKQILIQALARLISKAARANPQEQTNE